MSQLDRDAAKRAAAGESLGAFVTLDINRLEKDELIMLGMREMLSKYLGIVNAGIVRASSPGRHNPDLYLSLMDLGRALKADSDTITEDLTRSAMRRKTATLREIPKDPT